MIDRHIFGEREPSKANSPTDFNYELVKKPVLAQLALKMSDDGVTVVTDGSALREQVAKCLLALDQQREQKRELTLEAVVVMPKDYSALSFLREVVENGMLVRDDDGLRFMHESVQEYFAAVALGTSTVEDLKQKADTWHAMPGDTHQEHEKVLRQEEGAVLGRHRVLVRWHGAKNDVFALEERELTVYNVPGGTLVEFASKLKTAGGKVKLDGDPQHAGFQFRAANAVAEKTAKQTYYLRPDGKGALGATCNWDPKTKEGPVNLPWDAMSFVLGDKRYTVAYLNSSKNPKESRFSERDYGRFGCYFE